MLRFHGGFSSSARGRGCRGDSVTCAPNASAGLDEVASAVCAPLNPTIPTRLFTLLPSPSPRPRVLRLRRPPRLRSIEGQPSHSQAAGAGTRRAVPRSAPCAGRPESRGSPKWAVRRAESRPSLAGPDPHWSSPRREGGPVPAPAVAPPPADRRLWDTGAQKPQHERAGLGLSGSPRGWPCPFAAATATAPAGNFAPPSPLPCWPRRDSSPNGLRGPAQRA